MLNPPRINLREIGVDYRKTARSFAELVPWLYPVTERVIANKDSALMACFTFDGVDLEGMTADDISRHADLEEKAYQAFLDEPVTLWWQVKRRRTTAYPQARFPDPVSQRIDDNRRRAFQAGRHYVNRHYLTVALSPAKGSHRFFQRLHFFLHDEQQPFAKALFSTGRTYFSGQYAFAYDKRELEAQLACFEEMLDEFANTLRDYRLVRLSGGRLLGFLQSFVTTEDADDRELVTPEGQLLDGYLPDCTTHVGREHLILEGNRRRFLAGLSVKAFPGGAEADEEHIVRPRSYPGMLDALLKVPGEITVSQVFRFASLEEAGRFIRAKRRFNDVFKFNWQAFVRGVLRKGDMTGAKVNPVRERGVGEATEALGLLETQKAFFGFWNLTVLCHGNTPEEADETAHEAHHAVSHGGFISVRERLHLLSAYTGTLPGMWAELVRWYFISTGNLADFSPARSIGQGSPTNDYLSEQMRRPCPALAVLTTIFSIPYHFNFHVKDLGHTFVVGPSRTGKTVFMMFLIAQFRKYFGARIYIFDKDHSCRIGTLLMGGQHIDLDFEARTVRLNPLLLLGESKLHGRIKEWLAGLLTCRGYEMTEEDHQCLMDAVKGTWQMGPKMWRLRFLYPLLSPRPKLQTLLAPWVHEGEFAHIYDNEEDSFSLSRFTCTEMGRILAVKEVACSFTDYVFLRIDIELDRLSERDEDGELVPRVPTLIYFEEGWYFLEEPAYRSRFRNYSKTLAKKLGMLATSTQSLEDIADSPVFPSIRDNFATKIFLPNRSAHTPALKRLYGEQFLLNEAQIAALASATPKKHYLISQGGLTRLVSADLDAETLACLRSDSEAQAVFDKHFHSGHADWRERYIQEMCRA